MPARMVKQSIIIATVTIIPCPNTMISINAMINITQQIPNKMSEVFRETQLVYIFLFKHMLYQISQKS